MNLFKSFMAMTSVCQGIDVLLPIYFFIPSICPAHDDVTNFIDFDWFQQLFGAFFDLKLLIFQPLQLWN